MIKIKEINKKDKQKEGTEPLNLENTLWSGTVLASDVVIGLVVYTGSETRSALNTAPPATKVPLLSPPLFIYLLFFLLFIYLFIYCLNSFIIF